MQIKKYLLYGYMIIKNYIQRYIYKSPKVISANETLDLIIKKKLSIARFGDGELDLILGIGNGFQNSNDLLKKRLSDIINAEEENLLICIPDVFTNLSRYTFNSKFFWLGLLTSGRRKSWQSFIHKKIYYDALLTRPYMMYKNKNNIKQKFEKISKIWHDKEILIIEGEFSRLGVGNDLFNNAKNIQRIICPSENAFDRYDEIIDIAKKYSQDKLILIALGQTATVLAYDLHKYGFQALDIGHIDVEYEWFLRKCKVKEKIQGKYVNEVSGGYNVEYEENSKYEAQIIYKVK